jgi:hypothetical protein
MDVSSANNLHKPIVSSAMSLIHIKKRKGPRMDPWGPCLKITVPRNLIFYYIFYFNTTDIPPGLFWIENTRIYPVKCHKHLGITLSADWKLSNHINTIIAKTSKKWQFCENLILR